MKKRTLYTFTIILILATAAFKFIDFGKAENMNVIETNYMTKGEKKH